MIENHPPGGRVLGACSGGQVLHLQLAASVPHDFSDLADEFMAFLSMEGVCGP
jgi:hypothetical protein